MLLAAAATSVRQRALPYVATTLMLDAFRHAAAMIYIAARCRCCRDTPLLLRRDASRAAVDIDIRH